MEACGAKGGSSKGGSMKLIRIDDVLVTIPDDAPEPEIEIEISFDDAEAREEKIPPPVPLIIPVYAFEDPMYIREDLWKVW